MKALRRSMLSQFVLVSISCDVIRGADFLPVEILGEIVERCLHGGNRTKAENCLLERANERRARVKYRHGRQCLHEWPCVRKLSSNGDKKASKAKDYE